MKKFILIIMFLSLGSLSQNEELLAKKINCDSIVRKKKAQCMKKTRAKDLNENKRIIEKSEDSEAEYIWENFMYEMDR